jgi:hypothetical protein
MASGGRIGRLGHVMETTGDSEAAFLREIADAITGREIGLLSIGRNEDGTFSIVVESEGVAVAFTSPSPDKIKNAFIRWSAQQPLLT